MEVALVLVLRVEARVRIGAYEIAARNGRLEERDVIDVDARGLCRIEDVRHVYEDGDVLAHLDSLMCQTTGARRSSAVGVSDATHRGSCRNGSSDALSPPSWTTIRT